MDTRTWFEFFALLTVAADLAVLALWGVVAAARVSPAAADLLDRVRTTLWDAGLALATLVAGTAMAGSLYLSEGAHLTPCTMCWYQRIAMYSLAVILLVAVVRRDWHVRPFAGTLAALGPVVSVYHYLEQRFPSLEGGTSCDPNNPCTQTLVWKYHYVSIPFMALSAFLLVLTILALARRPDPVATGRSRDDGALTEVQA